MSTPAPSSTTVPATAALPQPRAAREPARPAAADARAGDGPPPTVTASPEIKRPVTGLPVARATGAAVAVVVGAGVLIGVAVARGAVVPVADGRGVGFDDGTDVGFDVGLLVGFDVEPAVCPLLLVGPVVGACVAVTAPDPAPPAFVGGAGVPTVMSSLLAMPRLPSAPRVVRIAR